MTRLFRAACAIGPPRRLSRRSPPMVMPLLAATLLLLCVAPLLAAPAAGGHVDAHAHHHVAEAGAGSWWQRLTSTDYTPRRLCMNEEADVVWSHVIGDGIITAAYFSIPFALLTLLRRRRDLAFNWMFGMFASFILLCGVTHLFGIIAIWNPPYRLDGYLKLLTGAVSATTAIALWPLIPRIIQLPSPRMLAEANASLEAANVQLAAANAELSEMRQQLEERVAARTADLEQINARLMDEVDARQRAQIAERSAREEAEKLNRIKDEFLSTLSHELRTPLNAIMGWAQILASHLPANGERQGGAPEMEEIAEGVQTIERNARAQSQIVNDLLDMSRIISGKLRIEPRPTDACDVLAAAVDTVRPAADARQIELVVDFAEGEGEADDCENLWVMADADRLQQVAWNLLTNAVKFTHAGGRVTVRAAREEDTVSFSVTDTGQGIDPEFKPFVFDAFRQADGSASRQHGGLGLGLSIARRLVEMHGGTIAVESEGTDRGATFTVRLPASQRPAEGHVAPRPVAEILPPRAAPAESAPVRAGPLSGVSVLVVDDEPDARRLMQMILSRAGAAVDDVGDPVNALSRLMAPESRPTVVLADIGMPGTTGYELIRAVRAWELAQGIEPVAAAAVTAYARATDRRRAFDAGFQAHLVKPVDARELILQVAALAGRPLTVQSDDAPPAS